MTAKLLLCREIVDAWLSIRSLRSSRRAVSARTGDESLLKGGQQHGCKSLRRHTAPNWPGMSTSVGNGRRAAFSWRRYKTSSHENQVDIKARTEIEHGITIAKFLGGYGDSITFDHVTKLEDRLVIARNLYLHGQVMKSIMIDDDEYDEYRLVVAEGIYRAGPNEILTEGGINDLKSKGRCVVYELRNRRGEIDKKKTFDLAVWWKDSLQFEKMILSYDTYNVGASITAQIILIMPEVKSDYIATYKNEIETRFNNYVQSTNELVEVV